MDGTTRCPHCDTRFKIGITQLEAHQGMVRCGKCMQVFDARPGFIADQPSPQLELVITERSEETPEAAIPGDRLRQEASEVTETPPLEPDVSLTEQTDQVYGHLEDALDFVTPRPPVHAAREEVSHLDNDNDDTLDESIRHQDNDEEPLLEAPARKWVWAVPATVLTLLLVAQAAYIFRADLAARQPELRPVLEEYCVWLDCKVGLPQNNDLMSIESSSLEANPAYNRQITLHALLRNRASYTLAYPDLELTLNDRQDSPVARRIFKPADYLSAKEKVELGLGANQEANVQLQLDTSDLDPNGYRLALYYPAK